MHLIDAYREAEVGEELKSASLPRVYRKGQAEIHGEELQAQIVGGGVSGWESAMGVPGILLYTDDWEIIGRYPAPVAPGSYWHRGALGDEVVSVVGSVVYFCGRSDGVPIAKLNPRKWGPRADPPESWAGGVHGGR